MAPVVETPDIQEEQTTDDEISFNNAQGTSAATRRSGLKTTAKTIDFKQNEPSSPVHEGKLLTSAIVKNVFKNKSPLNAASTSKSAKIAKNVKQETKTPPVKSTKKLTFAAQSPGAKKIRQGTGMAFVGTPKQADPANLLRKNLKKRVAVKLVEKVAEMPANSSPYALVAEEDENGSPVENFVRVPHEKEMNYLTGTPGIGRKRKILQSIEQNSTHGSPHPVALTPKRKSSPARSASFEPSSDLKDLTLEDTPVLETENVAVNKLMARQSEPEVPQSPERSEPQVITGDLGKMCLVM